MNPDLGVSLTTALNAVISARREMKEDQSFWSRTKGFFGKKELSQQLSSSLTTLKTQGYIPQDFIENEINWNDVKWPMEACIDFGFTFDHMLTMGFQPQHFKQFEWRHYKQLRVDAQRMMQTGMAIHDLNQLSLTPQQLHQLKWTWGNFVSIGGNDENINFSATDKQLYFQQSVTETTQKIGRFVF